MSSVPTSTPAIADPRAWRADAIDDRAAWYFHLPSRCLGLLDQTVRRLRDEPRPTTELQVRGFPCADCGEDLFPVLDALEGGRGFVIIDRLPLDRYSVAEAQALYWLLGQLLGSPRKQNVQGMLLYDVRDTGQDVKYGARFSVTNAESTFHTDNSFGAEVSDYVGLLCLKTAKSGGLNHVVSGYAVHDVLRAEHPGVLATLAQPFHVDRRGGVGANESPTVLRPIIEWVGDELICRYLRYWIEVGHAKAGEPLTASQVQAMDVLDDVLRRADLRVEFALEPGQVFLINNRWILHNRTAFDDHADTERRRHYVRLWLKARAA